MKDFVNWCVDKDLIDITENGVVTWKEACDKKIKGGGRDIRKDLSSDYKDPAHKMEKIWPFKVVAKGKGKAVAPVGK